MSGNWGRVPIFIDGGGSEAFGRQDIEDPFQRDRLTGNAHGSDRRDTDRKEKESLDMAGAVTLEP